MTFQAWHSVEVPRCKLTPSTEDGRAQPLRSSEEEYQLNLAAWRQGAKTKSREPQELAECKKHQGGDSDALLNSNLPVRLANQANQYPAYFIGVCQGAPGAWAAGMPPSPGVQGRSCHGIHALCVRVP